MHEVPVNRLGGLSLPRKSVVRLTDRPDMTLGVYRGRKTTTPQSQLNLILRPDCTSKLVHGLAFGTTKIYIAPYGKMNHGLVNLSYNYDVKSGLTLA